VITLYNKKFIKKKSIARALKIWKASCLASIYWTRMQCCFTFIFNACRWSKSKPCFQVQACILYWNHVYNCISSIARVLELWKGTGLSGKMKWTRIQCWFTYISMPAGVITDSHVSRYKHTFYTRMMSIIVFTLTARGFEIRKGSGISSKNIHQ